jgi:hypothetical protein
MGCGKLSRFGGLCVWMYFSREVSKDKPQLFSDLPLKRFDDRMSTVSTFVVAMFDHRNRGVGLANPKRCGSRRPNPGLGLPFED